jgi:hypothetical protein
MYCYGRSAVSPAGLVANLTLSQLGGTGQPKTLVKLPDGLRVAPRF